MKRALTIAGSDSSGGAGIQADLKTFQRHGVYGASALTLVTAQNTVTVERVHLLPPDLVARQIALVLDDVGADVLKTGALGSAAIIRTVAHALATYPAIPLVLDPVMVSKHGTPLLAADAVHALVSSLFPRAMLATPNVPETESLLGAPVRTETDMLAAARALLALGPHAVLVKGGHLDGDACVDLLVTRDGVHRFVSPRVATAHTHGTGCTYSAAIAARIALGDALHEAVAVAHDYVARAIAGAPGLGHGHGPLDHLA